MADLILSQAFEKKGGVCLLFAISIESFHQDNERLRTCPALNCATNFLSFVSHELRWAYRLAEENSMIHDRLTPADGAMALPSQLTAGHEIRTDTTDQKEIAHLGTS